MASLLRARKTPRKSVEADFRNAFRTTRKKHLRTSTRSPGKCLCGKKPGTKYFAYFPGKSYGPRGLKKLRKESPPADTSMKINFPALHFPAFERLRSTRSLASCLCNVLCALLHRYISSHFCAARQMLKTFLLIRYSRVTQTLRKIELHQ